MSDVARVTEISARSPNSFEDTIKVGIARDAETLRNVSLGVGQGAAGAGGGGEVVEYQVNVLVTFVLEQR